MPLIPHFPSLLFLPAILNLFLLFLSTTSSPIRTTVRFLSLPETVFLSLHSSKVTYSRLSTYTQFLTSHPAIPSRIRPELFVPDGAPPPRLRIPIHSLPVGKDTYFGLCERVFASYTFFLLNTTSAWYFRAIDDTWISPENLLEFVDDLRDFIDPRTDIVMKACKTHGEEYLCGCWLEGGVGWLLSRAAVMQTVAYDFLNICGRAYSKQDDTSMGIIMAHTFPDARFWDSVRMTGNPYYTFKEFVVDSEETIACNCEIMWPVRKMMAFHTSGDRKLIEFMKNVRKAPLNLAIQWCPGTYQLCKASPEKLKELVGLEALKKWTPVVKFKEGGQVIAWNFSGLRPPVECRQCLGLLNTTEEIEWNRSVMWNRTGWQRYYD